MLDKNSIPLGLGIGLLLPLIGFGLIYFLYGQLEAANIVSEKGFSPYFRERTAGIIAICLNLLPLNYYQKRRATNSMRGVVLATIVLVIIWVVYFGSYIL